MSSFEDLREVVSDSILQRAGEVSRLLADLNIPHVLVGGLAVGVHGYPRATADVVFLVGREAFEGSDLIQVYRDELKHIARVGETDIMSVPTAYPCLADELRLEDDIPVISLRGLVLIKLDSNRARDREDVRVLMQRAPKRIREVSDYLKAEAPELVTRFAEVVSDIW